MYRLAHVTDPHFRGYAGLSLGALAGKRAIGFLNLAFNRRRHHKLELLAALGEDLRAQGVDHLALTGDLSNISLAGEWRAALLWIERHGGAPDAVTVIPGNHDAYVAEVVRTGAFERIFGSYQSRDLDIDGVGDPSAVASGDPRAAYPFVRLRGPLALIGVNSCVATGDLGAWGEVGAGQLQRLESVLARAEVASRVRVVLVHHPPVLHKGGEHRNLRDRAALTAVLARAGADLVLHGHDHRDESAVLDGPWGRGIAVVGAGSASYAGAPERRARYNIYEIGDGAITLVTRAHVEAKDRFEEVRRAKIA
ncbi:MAG TPA: metallophosphoesterase [Polyangia bacterium]|nr:metallophosphoesterase [Polyangia bacterium]